MLTRQVLCPLNHLPSPPFLRATTLVLVGKAFRFFTYRSPKKFAWGAIPEKYGTDDVAFVMELMERSGVLCTPGSSFGSLGKGHVRFALTMPVEQIQAAVKAVKESGMIE